MSHNPIQKILDLQVGSRIRVQMQYHVTQDVIFVRRETGVLIVRNPGMGLEWPVTYEQYMCTVTETPDLEKYRDKINEIMRFCLHAYTATARWNIASQVWSLCEQNYGIDESGSQTKDRIREFALAVLKGDPIACDAVRDILRE